MSFKWEPVLVALAEQEGCYETRIGSHTLPAWYECRQHSSYLKRICLLCTGVFHETFCEIRTDQSDSEMRVVLIARNNNAAVHAIELHAAKHADELERRFGPDLLDAAEAALRMGMDSHQVVQDILKLCPHEALDRKEPLPWR